MQIDTYPYRTPRRGVYEAGLAPDANAGLVEMSLEAFADAYGLVMEAHEQEPRFWATNARWRAQFTGAEIKEDKVLRSAFGRGATVETAMLDYMGLITGQLLVLNGYGSARREIRVPRLVALR